MSKTVLSLTPHPDDAEIFAGGTLAKMAANGDHIIMAIATDGRCGSYEHDSAALAAMRAEEACRAAELLGAEKTILLGHPDMGLDLLPGTLREQFVRLIRQYRPDVVVTQWPVNLHISHPDHRQVAWAARDAIGASALPLIYPEHIQQGLSPHFVAEKYFYTEGAEGTNKVIDITDTMKKKIAALSAHTSQMRFLVQDILLQARVAGLEANELFAQAQADPTAAMAMFLEGQAEQAGKAIGVRFGEAFYYERYHPVVEALAGSNP